MLRVQAFVDGYNLYHAIRRLRQPHLKWVDLHALSQVFVPTQSARLVGVHYFTAYAYWLPAQMARHRLYVAALEAKGVTVHLSRFKTKRRRCSNCHTVHESHEEKETDVHLALMLLDLARRDRYDRALLLTRDSDLAPAVRLVKKSFPEKQIRSVAPPHLGHSNEILAYADGRHRIQKRHFERSLLPREIAGGDRERIVRPAEYDPPVAGTDDKPSPMPGSPTPADG